MPLNEIDNFMSAISSVESPNNNPDATNPRTGAHGLFQIMPEHWPDWSRETYGEVVQKTPQAQRRVAKNKMSEYYKRYQNWDLVAAAWFGGPGAANKLANGDNSVLQRSDGTTTIGEYINNIRSNMNKMPSPSQRRNNMAAFSPPGASTNALDSGFSFAMPNGIFNSMQNRTTEDKLFDMIDGVSNQLAGGRRNSFEEATGIGGRTRVGSNFASPNDTPSLTSDPTTDLLPNDDPNSYAPDSATRAMQDRAQSQADASGTVQSFTPAPNYMFGADPLSDPVDMTSTPAVREMSRGGMNAIHEKLMSPGDRGIPDNTPSDYTPPRNRSPYVDIGQNLVDSASQYLGVPYLWGGTDPSKGLDCSGLLQLAAKQVGIDLPRVSRQQAQAGKPVRGGAQNAKPGDLITFADDGRVHHIGMVVGDGKMLHAPRSGENVKIEDYNPDAVHNTRRITHLANE